MEQIRQGDVFLKEVKTSLKGLKKIASGSYTLALGEKTGHHHDIIGAGVNVYNGKDGQVLVEVTQEAELTHQEHDNRQIPVGIFEFVQQREFDIVEGVRNVLD